MSLSAAMNPTTPQRVDQRNTCKAVQLLAVQIFDTSLLLRLKCNFSLYLRFLFEPHCYCCPWRFHVQPAPVWRAEIKSVPSVDLPA